MVVQHNIMALNAYNSLSANNNATSKNLEKLSSGYKINRAGDDAAGLAISEKMRAQITGLERASDNAQDGISLVQTAEGALTEVHSMLNRMTELATQSANGTYDNATDRANLQEEVKSLQSEIDRIADETNFNGINLLDGSLGAAADVTTTIAEDAVGGTAYSNVMTVTAAGGSGSVAEDDTIALAWTDASGAAKTLTFTAEASANLVNGDILAADMPTGGSSLATLIQSAAAAGNTNATEFLSTFNVTAGSETEFSVTAKNADADISLTSITQTVAAGTYTEATFALGTGANAVAGVNPTTAATAATTELDFTGKTGEAVFGSTVTVGSTTYEFVKTGDAVTGTGNTAIEVSKTATASDIATAVNTALTGNASFTTDYTKAASNGVLTFTSTDTGVDADALEVSQKGTGLNLQIGDTASQRISVKVDSMDSKSLGIDLANVDISTEAGAKNAIATIKTAINTVSSSRAKMGAIQNRLEYTVNNLATTTENMTSAESRIRDTDMASEMMAYTKNNVLSQAAQAMLAQANQQPQQVLQLLQ